MNVIIYGLFQQKNMRVTRIWENKILDGNIDRVLFDKLTLKP